MSSEYEEDDSDTRYAREIFKLTEITKLADPCDYFTDESIPEAYGDTVECIRLSKTNKFERACRRLLRENGEYIIPLIDPLFVEIHGYLFSASIRHNSPPTPEICSLWNTCYGEIYVRIENKKFLDKVLDVLPYVLSHSIMLLYYRLPTPLGICPPARVDVARRIVFLFSSIEMLDTQLEAQMTRYFGREECLPAVPTGPEQPPVLIPVEDITGLVDIERRPLPKQKAFGINGRSPLSGVRHLGRKEYKFTYPVNGERTFHEDLKHFSQKPKPPDDMTPDLDTKSLLMRARCRNVEYTLQQAKIDAAMKRTALIHRFQHDREMIEMKKNAVLAASEKDKIEFMAQMSHNQSKGIYLEDPVITLELLRQHGKPVTIRSLSPGKRGKMEQIVDAVLNESAADQRRQNEVEVHCSHEFRNTVIDVRRVFLKEKTINV